MTFGVNVAKKHIIGVRLPEETSIFLERARTDPHRYNTAVYHAQGKSAYYVGTVRRYPPHSRRFTATAGVYV